MYYMRWTGRLNVLIPAALATLAVLEANGAQSPSREAFFRCKDQAGQTYYSDSMPQECMGLDTEVLNERGMVVRVIEGEASRAARLKREAAEAKLREEREKRLQRDRNLIETYLTVEDIERLRDQRLELLRAQYRVTEQNIANLRERQSRLETQIARFRPYSDKPNAPPLPDHLAEEIVNTVNSLRVYEESLEKNRAEQEQLKAEFAADIKRFKELKGLD
ncbi:MAG TPA: hypothetical protein VF193_04555 [Steroidobacter sp.]